MGATTNDIAKICNVSRTTVIRALNGQGRISQQTKEKVLQTAKDLKYRPDLLARGLVKGKTMYIGVVVFDVKNQYFAQMLSAIETEAKTKGYFVNITLHEKDKEKEIELIRRLVDYHVDGLILSPVNKGKKFEEFLMSLDTPIVIVGNKVSPNIPFVGIDEKSAAREATEKIAKANYEKIVLVCPPLLEKEDNNIYTHEEREKGFKEAIRQYPHIESVIIDSWNYVESAENELKDQNKKTAFFCSGDIFALDIVKHMSKLGKRAPSDYGIMGFDNIELLEYVVPKLSTIHNSIEEVSKKAVTLLFDAMEEKNIPKETYVDYIIMDGETI